MHRGWAEGICNYMHGQEKLAIDVLLREDQIATELQQALGRRFLDEKFFYWLPPSVQAWVELTRSAEYRNSNRALQVLGASAGDVVRMWPEAKVLCSLGCGEGSKDRILLRAYAEGGRKLEYVAADFSQALLVLALVGADSTASVKRGVKFDVAEDSHLRALSRNGVAAIYAVLGNTLGAFGPLHFPARLREIMGPGDRALFDGEIFDEATTLAGYDNPTNRRFAFSPLAGLGLTERDGELRFELRRGSGGIHEVAKYFIAARGLEVRVAGASLRLNAGETILMSSSIKYDEETFYPLIENGGFVIELAAKSEDGKFLLAGARPR
ncbi:MAG TPA: L-histidine N(alpha)-methyltransferase [Terriglobales bacterium]|nr:L-histidine N(alpha)-methyltransferase [Terriglobales bacterium]